MNKNYVKQKLHGFSAGFLLSMALAVVAIPPAYADDIDIYTQMPSNSPTNTSATPLVILTLDLNLNLSDVVCSNILANPNTLVGGLVEQTACKGLRRVAGLPVLGDLLDLNVGGVLNGLLGNQGLLGGVLSTVGLNERLSDLTNVLSPIVGGDGIVGNLVEATQLDVVRLLLYQVIHQLVGVRLAIIVSHADTCTEKGIDLASARANPATAQCSNGAYFLLAPTELLEDNLNQTVDGVLGHLNALKVKLPDASGEDQPDATPPFQGKEIYYELYRLLTGKPAYNAPLGADDLVSLPDPKAFSGGRYKSPLDDTTCKGDDIHVINIMFTDSMDDDESDSALTAAPLSISAKKGGKLTFADVTEYFADTGFMYKGARYRIKSNYLLNGPGAGGVGGLLNNLTNTVFTLPIGLNRLGLPLVSKETFEPVNTVSTSLGGPQPVFLRSDLSQASDALYYGMFKPNEDGQQAWRGNLKKLKMEERNGVLTTVDAGDRPAISTNGDLRPAALTFWTDAATLTNKSDLPEEEQKNVINGRDGPSVSRGGAGSFLIPPRAMPTKTNAESPNNGTGKASGSGGPRVFYENKNSKVVDLNLADTAVDDAAPLIGGDRLEVAQSIAWARGYETDRNTLGDEAYGGFLSFLTGAVSGLVNLVKDLLKNVLSGVFCIISKIPILGGLLFKCPVPAAQDPGPTQWVMGGVLHSDPLPIDYGNGDVRIFTGTNRGFLHEFRDTPLSGDSSTFGGQEVWRFAPRTMLANFNQWRTSENRPYGVDGAPVAWIKDTDGNIDASQGDHVYLYFGLRRGGSDYYALDVTNPDAAPKMLWHIAKTGAFANLGLTFSPPRVAKIRVQGAGDATEARTVLIFGGGYDVSKDADKGSASKVGKNDTKGNAIYVVDATTGALIWKTNAAGMTDSIPSEVTTLDTTGDGFVDRLYVGDTGGRVWRADIGASDPNDWKVAPIASLGRHGNNNVANDRRFFERPDVVRVAKNNSSFYALVIGSGNRADPLNRNTDNYLYVIKDQGAIDPNATPIAQTDLTDFSENCDSTDNCLSLLDTANVPSGWKIRLGPESDSDREGEKALSSPITISGKVFFTSYVPPSLTVDTCRPQEGTGRMYAIDLLNASGVMPLFAQDGEPGDSVSMDYARGTTMAAAGIPAGLTYIRPQTLLGSDFSMINVAHKMLFRTYWHERDGER